MFSSVVALILCFSMLVGTTFAWFTDEVKSGVNQIVAGNLDVNLYHSDDNVKNEPVTVETKLFDDVNPNLWEPGALAYEILTVANEGTLALKYQLAINFENATTVNGHSLVEALKVAVVDESLLTSREAAIAAAAGKWQKLESFVLPGELAAEKSETYGIVIYWEPTENDNWFNLNKDETEVLSIDLGVHLFATQMQAEIDSFGKDYDAGAYVTNEDFEEAITSNEKVINVSLAEDVTYDVGAWENEAMGGEITETIIINGNGHTITFNQTNSDWNNIVTNGAKLIINNAHITNAGNNNGPWNRHDLNFACEVELNNVTSDKAMAFKATATLNNVVISDANTADTYAIWIQPNGQTVTLNGCTIDMLACSDGRGIKIDNQYVDAPAKVTLNVSNTTFKTEEKAAILVKSAAGAEINLSNVDISNTTDPLHHVWVDEDSAAYIDLVTVTGGEMIGEAEANLATPATIQNMINNAEPGAVILLGAGKYGTIVMKSNITLYGTNGAVVDCVNLNGADNVTLKNITFDAAGAQAAYDASGKLKQYANIMGASKESLTGARNVVIDGCTFTGTFSNGGVAIAFVDQNRKSGQSGNITIKNCTFATAGAYYDIYTHYSGYGAFAIEDNTFASECQGKSIYLGRYQSGTPVVLKGNTFEKVASIDAAAYIQDHSNYGVSFDAADNTFAN